MRLGALATALFLTLVTQPPGHAQSPQTTPPPATLKVYSRETVVDITVTDANGNPVHGLKQSDFTVKEDNKPQPISSFEEFDTATSAAATQAPPKLPPNVYTNLQPPPASSALNILLLDFVSTAPVLAADCCGFNIENPNENPSAGPTDLALALAAQRAMKQEATKYFHHMPSGTRVSVIGMSWPSSVRILQGFTSDPALLSAAVDTLDYNTHAIVEEDPHHEEEFCAQADGRDRMTIEVLQQIAADLAGIKGKKNLIWLTAGTPYVTDPSTRPDCLPDYSVGLTRAFSLLTAAQVAVYPEDARGLTSLPDFLVTLSGKLIPNIPALGGEAHAAAVMDFQTKTAAEKLALESIAEATGGEAFHSTNDLAGAVGKAIDKGANYYTLSYVPPGTKYDGHYHKIKIEVDQPGLHLVYREGYAAEDPASFKPAIGLTLATTLPEPNPADPQATMRLAMGRAMPTSTQLLFDVQVEPSATPRKPDDPEILGTLDPKLKSKPLTRYAFQYSIPARQITFTPAPGGTHKGTMELDVAAYDDQGELLTSLSQTVTMPLDDARYQQFIQGPFRFAQQLDLPAGALFLRIGIFDPTANKLGTLEIPLTVSKGPPATTAGSSSPNP